MIALWRTLNSPGSTDDSDEATLVIGSWHYKAPAGPTPATKHPAPQNPGDRRHRWHRRVYAHEWTGSLSTEADEEHQPGKQKDSVSTT